MIRIAILMASLSFLAACGEDSVEARASSAVDQLCACKNERCVEVAEKRLHSIGREIEEKESSMSEQQLERLQTIKDRAEMCESGQGDPESDENKRAMAKVKEQFEEIIDELCACADNACQQAAADKLIAASEAAEDGTDLSEDMLVAATEEAMRRAYACVEETE